jgi:hypothetical protein
MEADGPEEIAEIIHTPCIFRKEEKARIVVPVMTVGNCPAPEPYHKFSHQINCLDRFLKIFHITYRFNLKFLLAVRRSVKYALRTGEGLPQTDALVCIYQIYSLVLRFAITVTYY